MNKTIIILSIISSIIVISCSSGGAEKECFCGAKWKGDYTNKRTGVTVGMNIAFECDGTGFTISNLGEKVPFEYVQEEDLITIDGFTRYKVIDCSDEELKLEHLVKKSGDDVATADIVLKKEK